jgi:nucleolar protein 12
VDPVPSGSSGSKRKADIDIGDSQNSASSGVKRRKSVTFGDTPKKPDHSAKRIVAESSTKKASKTEKAKAKAPQKQKQEEDNEEEGSDEELDDANLEDAYLMKNMARTLPRAPSKHSKPKPDSAASESGTDDEPTLGNEDESDDSEFSPLVHESIAPQKRDRSSKKKTKYIPEGETKEDRDARTIFIGNISVEVAKSKVSLQYLVI